MHQESTLKGIRVIEICNVAAGPFCGMLLADMGADVVKIEPPGTGDTLRSWSPITDGYSETESAHAQDVPLPVFRGEGKNLSAGFDFTGYQEQSEGDLVLRMIRIEYQHPLVWRQYRPYSA